MAKRKIRRRKVESDEGTWLVSYADMMTLICCFFILMMALANYEPVGFTKKVKEISKHFNIDKNKSSDVKLTTLTEEIASHPKLQKMTKISKKDERLIVSFSGTTLFKNDSYQLTDEMLSPLDALIDLIKTRDDSYKILIEGHTSNLPLRDKSLISKWHLSSLRASTVAQRFAFFGFNSKNIVPIGRGSTEPILANQDKFGENIKENIVLNDRVEIKILESREVEKSEKKTKLGLGVYFKD